MAEGTLLNPGIQLYNDRRYDDALAFFLGVNPESGSDVDEVSYYLGLCYVKLRRYEDALLYLEPVVTSGAKQSRVLQCRFILALIYTLTGRKRLASFEFDKLLEAGYKLSSVYASIAHIAWEEGQIDRCIECYEKSLELDPKNVTSMNGLGYVLACEEKDLTRALSYCKKAVASAPDSAACLDSLGWVYYKLGIREDAKKYLEMAEELDKDNELIAEHIKTLNFSGAVK
ncbi:MAG: tetratricopeptide repeat protein [Treponema sp.]